MQNDNTPLRSPTDLGTELTPKRAATRQDMSAMIAIARKARRALVSGDPAEYHMACNELEPYACRVGARLIRHGDLCGSVVALETLTGVGKREWLHLA